MFRGKRITVLDIETTITPPKGWEKGQSLLKGGNPSPYLPTNKLVSVHYGEGHMLAFANDFNALKHKKVLQDVLDTTDLLVGFNIKFDLSWLLECGFTYTGEIWDCQLAEYILSRQTMIQPSLDEVATHYGLSLKLDVVKEQYWKKGINTDAIPLDILATYGYQDVELTKQIFNKQLTELEEEENKGLIPTIELTNEFCIVLTDMERKGVAIDRDYLQELKQETEQEIDLLYGELQDIIYDVMGDTPINMNSPDEMSQLVYSRKILDKKAWARDIGLTPNQNKFERILLLKRLGSRYFLNLVTSNMKIIKRTDAKECKACGGYGGYQKTKKDGTPYKNETKCKACVGTGIYYKEKSIIGGLRVTPHQTYITANGFSTSKEIIDLLCEKDKMSKRAKEFLTKYKRYNALKTYLSTFIAGINNNIQGNILHSTFQQARTATGRLSSAAPNIQNFPRGDTYPIKKVFVSRWKGGIILDLDMSQLEFRVAAELANDDKARQDIINDVDIHTISASKQFDIPVDKVTKGIRQDAKPGTFAPLYGASKDWGLLERYPLIKKWHNTLITEAVQNKSITLPTGRQYSFPYIKRTSYGCTHQTKVKNYPVQGLATADFVPAIIIKVWHELRDYQSCIVSTIHDSIFIDIHPSEYEDILRIVKRVMADPREIIKDRYGIELNVPLKSDIKIGENALETKEI